MCAPEACTSFLPILSSGITCELQAQIKINPDEKFLDFERHLWILVPSSK
jgi:hypothetical protein